MRILVHRFGLFGQRASSPAVTSPLTGAYSSETAFTDSIVPKTSPFFSWTADLRQLEVDHVAKLLLRVVGDADTRFRAGDANPLVVFRVFQIGWIHSVCSARLLLRSLL